MKNLKEELLIAIEIIKENTGLSQGEISEKAGYASNYLAEAISAGKISKKLLSNVKRTFYTLFEDVSIIDGFKDIKVKDAPGSILEALINIESRIIVLFGNEAEKTAKSTGKKATDVLREMNAASRLEAQHIKDALRKKS